MLGASEPALRSLPLRRSTAAKRNVDRSRAQHDALDLQSHEIAVAEFPAAETDPKSDVCFRRKRAAEATGCVISLNPCDRLLRTYLFEAATVLLYRTKKWSALKAWG